MVLGASDMAIGTRTGLSEEAALVISGVGAAEEVVVVEGALIFPGNMAPLSKVPIIPDR